MSRSASLYLSVAILLLSSGGSAVASSPVVTAVQPTVLMDGDELQILGHDFVADASRYSILLRDGAGPVAWAMVTAASENGLTATLHGLGRSSDAAVVEIRQGVSTPLVGQSPDPGVGVEEVSWFQGSGDGASFGSVIFVGSGKSAPTALQGSAEDEAELLEGCPVIFVPIDIPAGCNEITVRVTAGGHDPFGGLASRNLGGAPLLDSWQAVLEAKIELSSESGRRAAASLAGLLSAHFGSFGLQAQVTTFSEGSGVALHGARITAASAGTVTDLRCPKPKAGAPPPG